MAQKAKHPASAHDTLDEIESWGERASEWLTNNARRVLVVAMVVIVLAGAYAGWDALESSREEAASNAFEDVRQAYMAAMGAPPGAIEVPELANPEAARAVRDEYSARFRELAEDHAGTVGGIMARLEEASILAAAGDDEGRMAALTALRAELPSEPRLRGLVLQRIAHAHEDAEQWAEAAEAHAEAGELAGYPLRYWAMADAARCFLETGDRDRSVALLATVKAEAPDLPLPEHVQTRLQEIPAE